MKKIICFDLDNTLCKTSKNLYRHSKPIKKNIKVVNDLYDKGYIIKIFTSRFMGRSNENQKLARKKGHKLTLNQLSKWKVKYHKLLLGKPSYDLIIDDKALGYDKNCSDKLKSLFKQ